MRFIILTGCFLSLGLTACSQNPIKSGNGTVKPSVQQQAVQGLNAVYAYPSFDYASQIKFNIRDTANTVKDANAGQAQQHALDPEIRKKLDQFFAAKQIRLKAQDKTALYQALSEQQYILQAAGSTSRFQQFSTNLLNDLDLSLAGSVHWKKKQASMNLQLRYAKPTLLVQAQVPMVLDLQDYRFYSNFFALMPFLVNRESQGSYAYLDFSKYRPQLERIDRQAGVQFLKEISALAYVLADPQKLTRIPVSAEERRQGVVEKIRLQGNMEENLLQSLLFFQVNEQHVLQRILKVQAATELPAHDLETSLEKNVADYMATKEDPRADTKQTLDAAGQYQQILAAYWQQLAEQDLAQDPPAAEPDCDCEDEDSLAASEEAQDYAKMPAAEQGTEPSLSLQQCQQWQDQPSVTYAAAYRCLNEYRFDVLQHSATTAPVDPAAQQQKLAELKQKFNVYNTGTLVSADQFQKLWKMHQNEIQNYLRSQQQAADYVVELELDRDGRLLRVLNQLNLPGLSPQHQLQVKVDTQISRYGQATPIDQQALKQAKPLTEVVKGSALAGLLGNILQRSGLDTVQQSPSAVLSFDEQLEQIAAKIYSQKPDYITVYNAVFLASLAQQYPAWVQHFSAQTLTEVASLHAYRYASADALPRTTHLEQQSAIWQQHQHWTEASYQETLGIQTAVLVERVIEKNQQKNALKRLKHQYPKPQQQFSALYVESYNRHFQQDYNYAQADLKHVADLLGQAYATQQKQALKVTDFKGLEQKDQEFIELKLIPEIFAQLEEK